MDTLRIGFFIPALLCLLSAVVAELNAEFLHLSKEGLGIRYLALVDATVCFTGAFWGLSLIPNSDRALGIVQGVAAFFFFLALMIGGVLAIIFAITFLTMLVNLFLAVPFGTLAYIGEFGDFARADAAVTLGLIMLMKTLFAVLIVMAYPRFLAVKSFILLILCSLLANVFVSACHNFVPIVLVSILDAVGAIVVGIIGVVWALIRWVFSIVAIVKTLRVDKALT